MEKERLATVAANFRIDGELAKFHPYGAGHMHDTYLIETNGLTEDKYLLQKINHNVFKDISRLMENISRVTEHIREKKSRNSDSCIQQNCLTLIKTHSGESYYKGPQGNYWRIYLFIAGTHSYNKIKNPGQAYEAGKAFGEFQAMVADLPGKPLHETIPDFHNIEKRLANFYQAIRKDAAGRVHRIQAETEFIHAREAEMRRLPQLAKDKLIRQRVTHNDTKFNNILFDDAGKVLCVVDLDTVMPGLVHYDFGDAIRTVANTGSEDDVDLDRVNLNIELFEVFTNGFLEKAIDHLNETELKTLAFSARFMTFIMGLRFLTDFIEGDVYYKTQFDTHNLQRAKAQFKLLKSMETQATTMAQIVNRLAGNSK